MHSSDVEGSDDEEPTVAVSKKVLHKKRMLSSDEECSDDEEPAVAVRRQTGVRITWTRQELSILKAVFDMLKQTASGGISSSDCNKKPILKRRTTTQIKSRA
jgi:hypothetical protein